MRRRSARERRSGPTGRNSWSRGSVGPAPLRAGRRAVRSPTAFASLRSALVLTDSVRQMRADLPDDRVRVGHRDGDRVLVHQAPLEDPQVLLDGGQLGFFTADLDEDRGLIDVLLHDRRDHPAAAILEVLAEGQRLDRLDRVVVDQDALEHVRDLHPAVEDLEVASPAVEQNAAPERQTGRDVDEPDRETRREQLALVDGDACGDKAGGEQHGREETLLHPQEVGVQVLVAGRSGRRFGAHRTTDYPAGGAPSSQPRLRSTARRHRAWSVSASSRDMRGSNSRSSFQSCPRSESVQSPAPSPARKAAPSAVVSVFLGRRTGRPSRSAWNWQSTSMTAAPPSTRSSVSGLPVSRSMASTTSLVWYAIASTAARTRWARLEPRVSPVMVPRAYGSQWGAPRPVNAGTRNTPPASGTDEGSGPASDALAMMPRPSRSHCRAAPVTKIAPSSA